MLMPAQRAPYVSVMKRSLLTRLRKIPAFNIADSGSRVHYLNPFGFFISGEVWDPEADLIIEGAKVTLRCPSGETLETETDGFGDFWFKHLNLGEYVLNIEAPGFKGVKNKPITLQESLNIGDFPLEKE